jgi:GNAT superfamily N-acetyltransferase
VTYRIREVDGDDDDTALTLHALHEIVLHNAAPPITPEVGWWWLAYADDLAVAFAGFQASAREPTLGYLCRSGVVKPHRGHGLQLRLIKVRENKARKLGMTGMVTDTYDNPASSNSLIRAGYKLYRPQFPWAFKEGLYWQKDL